MHRPLLAQILPQILSRITTVNKRSKSHYCWLITYSWAAINPKKGQVCSRQGTSAPRTQSPNYNLLLFSWRHNCNHLFFSFSQDHWVRTLWVDLIFVAKISVFITCLHGLFLASRIGLSGRNLLWNLCFVAINYLTLLANTNKISPVKRQCLMSAQAIIEALSQLRDY